MQQFAAPQEPALDVISPLEGVRRPTEPAGPSGSIAPQPMGAKPHKGESMSRSIEYQNVEALLRSVRPTTSDTERIIEALCLGALAVANQVQAVTVEPGG